MKKVFSHIKRVFLKLWFILLLAFAISPIIGLGVFIIAVFISLVFFNDPIEKMKPEEYFTEDELKKIQSNEDDNCDDDEYLTLLAKYQSYECPVKINQITTWINSEVTTDSFICNYEINDKWHQYDDIDMTNLKQIILSQIDRDNYQVKSLIATNRNIIHRFRNCQTMACEDIVISKDELQS